MKACLTTNIDVGIQRPLFAEIEGCSSAKINGRRVESMLDEIVAC
jgi:hypothetical protein